MSTRCAVMADQSPTRPTRCGGPTAAVGPLRNREPSNIFERQRSELFVRSVRAGDVHHSDRVAKLIDFSDDEILAAIAVDGRRGEQGCPTDVAQAAGPDIVDQQPGGAVGLADHSPVSACSPTQPSRCPWVGAWNPHAGQRSGPAGGWKRPRFRASICWTSGVMPGVEAVGSPGTGCAKGVCVRGTAGRAESPCWSATVCHGVPSAVSVAYRGIAS